MHDLLYCKQIYVLTGDEEACDDLSDYDESLESLSEDDRNDTGKTWIKTTEHESPETDDRNY